MFETGLLVSVFGPMLFVVLCMWVCCTALFFYRVGKIAKTNNKTYKETLITGIKVILFGYTKIFGNN